MRNKQSKYLDTITTASRMFATLRRSIVVVVFSTLAMFVILSGIVDLPGCKAMDDKDPTWLAVYTTDEVRTMREAVRDTFGKPTHTHSWEGTDATAECWDDCCFSEQVPLTVKCFLGCDFITKPCIDKCLGSEECENKACSVLKRVCEQACRRSMQDRL